MTIIPFPDRIVQYDGEGPQYCRTCGKRLRECYWWDTMDNSIQCYACHDNKESGVTEIRKAAIEATVIALIIALLFGIYLFYGMQ